MLKTYPSITVLSRLDDPAPIAGYPKQRLSLLDHTEELSRIKGLESDYILFTDGHIQGRTLINILEGLISEKACAAYLSDDIGSGEIKYLPFLDKRNLIIERKAFIQAGGFDDNIEAGDIDLGFRLWVMGSKTLAVGSDGDAIAGDHRKVSFEDRLKIAYKNFSNGLLGGLLWLCLEQADMKSLAKTGLDPKDYCLSRVSGNPGSGKERLSSEYIGFLNSVKSFINDVKRLEDSRVRVQSLRKRLDKSMFYLFGEEIIDFFKGEGSCIKSPLGIEEVIKRRSRIKILVISNEVVAKNMAGPGIRSYNISKQLSGYFDVTLIVPNEPDITCDFDILKSDESILRNHIEDSDIIITSGTTVAKHKFLKDSDKLMVFDLYDPYNIASLAEYENLAFNERMEANSKISGIIDFQIKRGDYLLCATQRQKDLWTGMANALGRFKDDILGPNDLIGVVPFGMEENPPSSRERAIKGKVAGIGKEDYVILWGGGIYNWFDPLSLIKAMDILKENYIDIKLFFMGVRHPNPEVKELKMAGDTFELAKELGLLDRNVFFNFGWVDYGKRADYLLDSDIGIITYPDHIETRFSFRTRVLDYLWAGLPVVLSRGDYLSMLVSRERLGISIENRAEDISDAIIKLYEDKAFYCECRQNIQNIRKDYAWEKVTRPLIDYCKDPAKRHNK